MKAVKLKIDRKLNIYAVSLHTRDQYDENGLLLGSLSVTCSVKTALDSCAQVKTSSPVVKLLTEICTESSSTAEDSGGKV